MSLPFRNSKNGGFVKAVIIIVVALLIISALGYNLRDVISDPNTKDNFGFAWEWVLKLWGYVKGPVQYIWNEVILKLIIKQGVIQHAQDTQAALN
jgi:hypothetical protein